MTYPDAVMGQRADALAQAGHTWMDPSLQASVIATPTTNDQMLSVANVLRSAWNNSANPLSSLTEDPVLVKQPSLALQVHQFLTDSIGYLPVAQPDLTVIQRNLQNQGFGQGLPVNGVWSNAWYQQWDQAYQAHVQQQIEGNRPGSFSFSKAAHGFINSLMPSHAIPALWGAVKSLPGGLRDLAAEVAGDVGATYYDVTHGTLTGEGGHRASQYGAGWAATVESALGKHENATQAQADESHRFINSIGTLLALAPITKAGSAVYDAAGTAAAKGSWQVLSREQAMRGPGALAGFLYRAGTSDTGELYEKGLAQGFRNAPGLRMLYPAVKDWVGTAQQPGKFYVMRSVMTPYRIPGLGAQFSALGSVGMQGGIVRGIGAAANQIGPNSLGGSIYEQHPLVGPLGAALDLASAFSRPIGMDPSKNVSELAGAARAVANGALGPTGVRGAYELAAKQTGIFHTGDKPYEDLVRTLGEHDADWYLQTKQAQYGVGKYADQQVRGQALTYADREAPWWDAMHAAASDPAKFREGQLALAASPVQQTLAFFNDYNHIISDPRESGSQGLQALLKSWHMAEDIATNHGDQLITPEMRDVVAREQALSSTPEKAGFTREFVTQNHPGLRLQDITPARNDYQDAGAVQAKAANLFARLRQAAPEQAQAIDNELSTRQLDALTDGAASRMEREQGRATTLTNPAERAAAEQQIRNEAYQYLTVELHRNPNELTGMDTPQLVSQIAKYADRQASLVTVPLDADPMLRAKIAALSDLGYKLVYGKDVGLQYAKPLLDQVVVDGHLSWQKRMANFLGVNLDPVATADQATMTHATIERAWQQAHNAGKVNFLPGYDAAGMLAHTVANNPNRAELPFGARLAYGIGRKTGAFKAIAEHNLAAKGMEATAANLKDEYRAIEDALARGQSLRDLSFKQFKQAVQAAPNDIVREMQDQLGTGPITDSDARTLYTLYLKGMAQRPAWMMGLSRLEDMFRASLTPLGKAADVPLIGSPLERLAFLPNDLLRFRDRWRFMLSPTFSARRVVKTMLKMGLDGVTPTWRPYEAMADQGTLDGDLALLDKVFPEMADKGAGWDAMDKYLWQSDAFGWFNPRHFMAYHAGELSRQGVTDLGELRARLDRTFTYGDRTALERSMGMVFYPLSFNKTLYRNLGGYLLDHAGARYTMANALMLYDALDKHAHFGDWMQAHLPLVTELNAKFNAFEHGVNPGMFGGLNAPYFSQFMQLMAPKHISDPSNHAYQLVQSFVPALNDLNKLLVGYSGSTGKFGTGVLPDQLNIARWQAQNWVDDATRWLWGHPRSVLNPQHPATSAQAQDTAAWQLRGALVAKLGPVISYNYHASPDAKVTFPANFPGVGGQAIDKTSVGTLVKRFYPNFDPTAAAKIAQDKAYARQQFLAGLPNDARGNAYRTFTKLSDRVQGYVQRDSIDPATLGSLTMQFRTIAANMAEQDPQFLNYWNTYMRSSWGPLQDVIY